MRSDRRALRGQYTKIMEQLCSLKRRATCGRSVMTGTGELFTADVPVTRPHQVTNNSFRVNTSDFHSTEASV